MSSAAAGLAGWVARVPLWAHALGLLVVLVALLPVVGVGQSYSADEGAAIIQARSLAAGDGWIVEHPLPEVDPANDLYPLEISAAGPKGAAAYAKHPAYPVLLAAADRVGGIHAMVGLSVLGTWAAAVGAALLARRLAGGLGRIALWLAGLGCPLLFNAYWVIAHSLGAAAVGWAVLCVVAAAAAPRARPGLLVAAPILVALAALLRTEAVIFGLGLAAGTVGWGLVLRRPWLVVSGVGAGAAALAARVFDSRAVGRLVGEPLSSVGAFDARPSGSLVGERIDGFVATWLRAAPPGDAGAGSAFVLLAAVLIGVSGVALLRRRPGPAAVAAAIAAGLLALRALVLPPGAVPGLLMAFPILLLGAAGAASRPALDDRRAGRFVLAVLVLGWGGVLVTQYAEGGVAEWGGRYFAIGLPLAVALVLVGIRALLTEVPAPTARVLVGALAVIVVATSVASLRELRAVHDSTEQALATIAVTADAAGPRPVIVTDVAAVPRLDWDRFDQHRWLLADPERVPDLPARLADAGVDRWVLVSDDVDAALAAFDGVRVVDEASPSIVLVEAEP